MKKQATQSATDPIRSLGDMETISEASPWPRAGETVAHWRYAWSPRRAGYPVPGRRLGNARQLMNALHDRY